MVYFSACPKKIKTFFEIPCLNSKSPLVSQTMRVISLVPSWTETLIECGVNVVGRTRFCCHPSEKVKDIPAVGGTKDINWDMVKTLKADLLLLDQDENPKSFTESGNLKWHASHVRSVKDMPLECQQLGALLGNTSLMDLGKRWEEVLSKSRPKRALIHLPAVQTWIKKPENDLKHLVYVIWKNPWMTVSRETFIGSMLDILGYGDSLQVFSKPYPEFNMADFNPQDTCFLFSSEPYPFGKKVEELKKLDLFSAVVDGEAFSWFGLRSLLFLEKHLLE